MTSIDRSSEGLKSDPYPSPTELCGATWNPETATSGAASHQAPFQSNPVVTRSERSEPVREHVVRYRLPLPRPDVFGIKYERIRGSLHLTSRQQGRAYQTEMEDEEKGLGCSGHDHRDLSDQVCSCTQHKQVIQYR